MSERKYDAFISYRHADLDSYVAINLHKMLENFKVPRLADKELQTNQKRRINRIFRDKDELPVTNNLADSIMEALEESEYLIVICSPRTPESLWVRKEIETFIKMHGQKNVLAVLIEGEPQDSFPPELKQVKVQIPDENGELVWATQDIEPLAADVRGNSKRQVHRQMKKEVLRLAAPILKCSYDDLKQRHKEQKLKRTISFFAIVAGFLLAFGGFSTYQALQISHQSEIISEKSKALEEENDKTKTLQSKSLAQKALELYQNGDRDRGILLAQSALPSNLTEPDRPYVAQAQDALTQTLQVYETGTIYKPYCLWTQETNTDFVCMSPNGATVAALDEIGNLTVWSTLDGKELFNQKVRGSVTSKTTFRYLDDATLLYGGTEGIYALDAQTGEEIWSKEGIYVTDFAVCKTKPIVIFSDNYTIQVYDISSDQNLLTYEDELGYSFLNGLSISPSGQFASVGMCKVFDGEIADIYRFDLTTGEFLGDASLQYNWITEAQICDDGSCLCLNKDSNSTGNFLAKGPEAVLLLDKDGVKKWVNQSENTMNHDLFTDQDNIYYVNESNLMVLSYDTGECIYQIGYSNSILGYQLKNDGQAVYVFLQDGKLQGTDFCDSSNPYTYMQTDNKFALFMDIRDSNIVVQSSMKNLCLYKANSGPKMEEYPATDGYIMQTCPDSTGTYLAAADYSADGVSKVYVYDADEHNLLWSETLADLTGIQSVWECADQKHFAVVTYSDLYVYDWQSGQLDFHWKEPEEGSLGAYQTDEDRSVIYFYTYNGLFGYDLSTYESIGNATYEYYPYNGYIRKEANEMLCIDSEGYGVLIDTEGKKDNIDLPWVASLFDYCKEKDCYLVADTLANEIQMYNAKDKTLMKSISCNIATLEQLQFSPEGDKFYIQDLSHTIKIYDTTNFECIKSITNATETMGKWEGTADKNVEVILDADMYHKTAFLLNRDLDIIATVPNLWNMSNDGTKLFTVVENGIYAFPIYSTQELLDEVKQQLGERTLTKEEKEQYYVE